MKEETASAQNTQVGKYSTEQALAYYAYIFDLVKDGYPLNVMTPQEFINGEFEDE